MYTTCAKLIQEYRRGLLGVLRSTSIISQKPASPYLSSIITATLLLVRRFLQRLLALASKISYIYGFKIIYNRVITG